MKITKKPIKTHRIFIKIIDYSKPTILDEFGRKLIPVRWDEVEEEIDLGSVKKPNEEILEVRIEPIRRYN